jgi:hypothetical protein
MVSNGCRGQHTGARQQRADRAQHSTQWRAQSAQARTRTPAEGARQRPHMEPWTYSPRPATLAWQASSDACCVCSSSSLLAPPPPHDALRGRAAQTPAAPAPVGGQSGMSSCVHPGKRTAQCRSDALQTQRRLRAGTPHGRAPRTPRAPCPPRPVAQAAPAPELSPQQVNEIKPRYKARD